MEKQQSKLPPIKNQYSSNNGHESASSQLQQDVHPNGVEYDVQLVGSIPPSSGKQSNQNYLDENQKEVDLESPDLTYNQAKKIRTQVERDVELLRNRVRMLQLEEERALKKINETKKKTSQILDLKKKNDEKFQKQLVEQQQNLGSLKTNQSTNYEKRQKQLIDIKQKQLQMYESKKQDAEQLKQNIRQQQQIKNKLEYDQVMQNQERKNQLKAEKQHAQYKINDYLVTKHERAREETSKKMESEKMQIKNYELEAQQLELYEADLLRKLQETQQKEKNAFNMLESAMIDAAIPKKMRVGANQSLYSQGSGRSQMREGSHQTSVRSSTTKRQR
ncbi:UNKNOWN [Stylonychia lemnae]|uniref:Uncharacterized protein n=1 Tax=Stylonychia lemnae TaxID=5949 RepID=A0A078BCK7_STYLE|nr:UNKNOWN [Stylonychia lemnae]|eukprot:CDW90942.1 UNKNOWN [Stylonychia lemnae]